MPRLLHASPFLQFHLSAVVVVLSFFFFQFSMHGNNLIVFTLRIRTVQHFIEVFLFVYLTAYPVKLEWVALGWITLGRLALGGLNLGSVSAGRVSPGRVTLFLFSFI